MSAGRYSLPTPGKVTKMGWLKVGNRASFKKMNIFLMNILDFLKNEYMFWIHILDLKKWIILLNIFFGFSLQKRSLQNVSNSSQILQGSLVGPISIHFRGPWPKQGPPNTYFGLFFNLEWFSSNSFEWIILLNFPYSIEWIFFEWIFWILLWIEWFSGLIQWKNELSKKIAHP